MNKAIRKLALSSSIALALGGISTSFAVTSPQDTQQVADARRETQILTSFNMNRHLRTFDLSVVVDGNMVVLAGTVGDGICKDLAAEIAKNANGITQVENHIVVDANYMLPKDATSDRSFSEKVGDATITASVKSKLLWNSGTAGLDIHVDTNNSKVTLTGSASNDAERRRAGRIARDTEGVVGLKNEIVLTDKPDVTAKISASGAQAEQAMSDTWITAKVKASLMLTDDVDRFEIAVTTNNGVVSLHGVVDTAAERELAVQVTQDIRGVKKVEADGLTVG
jgi:osmotically-inducible protein OsmY